MYKALRPVKFDKQYYIGETIADEVIFLSAAVLLSNAGYIVKVEDDEVQEVETTQENTQETTQEVDETTKETTDEVEEPADEAAETSEETVEEETVNAEEPTDEVVTDEVEEKKKSFYSLNKAELKEELDLRGIEYKSDDTKAELLALLGE